MMRTLVVLVIVFYSCSKSPLDFMVKEGSVETERREVVFFDTIELNDIFDVVLISDSLFFIEVTAGKNVLPYIECEVTGTTLKIDNGIKGRWARPYHAPSIRIHFPEVRLMTVNEACDIRTEDSLHCENFRIYTSSELVTANLCVKGREFAFINSYGATGNYNFRGKINRGHLFPGGTATFNASELEIDTASIIQNSIVELTVTIKKRIEHIRFLRNTPVRIKGNPIERNLEYVEDTSLLRFE